MDNNVTLKQLAKDRRVPLWRVADRLGVTEWTVVRWLRKPVSQERYDLIRAAIMEGGKEATE